MVLFAFSRVVTLSNEASSCCCGIDVAAVGTSHCEDLIIEDSLNKGNSGISLLEGDDWCRWVIDVNVILIEVNNLDVKAGGVSYWGDIWEPALGLNSVGAGFSNREREVECLRLTDEGTSEVQGGVNGTAARPGVRAHAKGKDGVSIVTLGASP